MLRGISRRYREVRTCIRGLLSTRHVVMAHIVPIRRCNLACKYCNEYDHVSPPVPVETMLRRIDLLAALRTSVIGLTGGEPLMHPQVDTIIRHIRRRGMISGLITNGYFLTPEMIESLNAFPDDPVRLRRHSHTVTANRSHHGRELTRTVASPCRAE
jgi:MoaA/NifB/PqqE/SkfB family radical SAM enzyme